MRCSRLPPVVAMLRSCCDAPARIASRAAGSAYDQRVIREVGSCAPARRSALRRPSGSLDLGERQPGDVDEARGDARRPAS